ncbi:MAG: hypothetical protein KAS75_01520 [Planctomycetes bacterium]|nr:hypothetical protein [Planctomycetota bacterium]
MKKFLKKILVLGLIIAALQFLVGYNEEAIPSRIKDDVKALSVKQDIVLFSDSSNWYCSPKDTDRRRISEFLQYRMVGRRVLAIDDAAWHMGSHLAFCKYIAGREKKPSIIIISVNPSTFGPTWYRRPGYQFEKELFFLSAGPARVFLEPLRVFKLIKRNISEEEFDNTPVYCGDKLVGLAKDFDHSKVKRATQDMVRKTFVFHYMEPIRPDHQRLQDMLEIVKILRPLGIKLIFYVTPTDVQRGEAYLPGQFHKQVQANVEVIKAALKSEGVDLLDLSQAMPASHFSSGIYPNAHLDQYGRSFVAEYLAKVLKENSY